MPLVTGINKLCMPYAQTEKDPTVFALSFSTAPKFPNI